MRPRRLGSSLIATTLAFAGCSPQVSDSPPPAPATTDTPWFQEEARERGVDFVHVSRHEGTHLFPEIMGGGAALVDIDGDDDLDLYLVQSGSLHHPASDEGRNRLYVNDGRGRFEDRSSASGADDPGYGMGVAAGDYDNDGDVDLYVTNYGPNVLLRNDGGGRFEDVTSAAGVGDASWSMSASFVDYDRDGHLDLFVVNYVNWSAAIEQECFNNSGVVDYCLPTNYEAPAMDRLYRNEGNGNFRDVTVDAGLSAAFGNGLGVVTTDFDGDGWPDILVANDTMMNQLWMNREGAGLVDEALLRGCAVDEHGTTKAGMGVVAADFDDDGDSDVIIVNLQGQTDSFFRNDGGLLVDHTARVGLSTSSRRFTRFGIGLVDFDNDGLLDLYQANGGVIKKPERADADPYAEVNMLHRGTDAGRFEEVLPRGGTAPELVATSRAAAFGDVDGDGGVDAVVVNRDDPVYVLRNVVPDRGHWVRFRVLDEHGGDAYGARVVVRYGSRTVYREVQSAFSYLASNDPRVHVGLGDSTRVDDVTVHWVDGSSESFGEFAGDGDRTLRKGEGRSIEN